MARRRRQYKPKGGQLIEQRSIQPSDQLLAVGGDSSYVIRGGDISLSESGPVATADVAGYPPVSQCLQMIAGDCARLPLSVKKREANGLDTTPVAADQYAQRLIDPWGRPNDQETQFDLFYHWYFDALLWGGGYLWIDRIGAVPVGLYRLLPDRTCRYERGGRVWFVTAVYDPASDRWIKKLLPNEDVLYLEGVRVGEESSCPVSLYRKTFQAAIASSDFTVRYFKQGTQSGGILIVPPGASSKAIEHTEAQIKARSQPENWFRSLVLKDGFKWVQTTSDIKNANSVELDEQSARSVARIYNIPPSKLGIRDSVSYNSRESDRQEYLDSCLSSWLIQGRSQIHRKLILPSEQSQLIVDYTVDELALLDMGGRADWVGKGLDKKWLTRAEARRVMKLPPLPEEDNPNASGDVQAQAFNGAQVASLVEICNQVVMGNIPKASAAAMIKAAFPLLDATSVASIVDPLQLKPSVT